MRRDLFFAYLCWLPPHGLLGAHFLYLGRPWLALLYSCTLGCLFIGWLSDAFVLPSLVASATAFPPSSPPLSLSLPSSSPLSPPSHPSPPKDLSTLLKLYLTLGLFGAHRLYTSEPYIALLYLFTFGLFGLGFLSDAFQLAYLLDRANHPLAYERYSLFTAYQLLIPPFGLLGCHHFYLGKKDRGWWYVATGGLVGLGTLYDVFTMPTQVREANCAYIEAHADSLTRPPTSPSSPSSLPSRPSSSSSSFSPSSSLLRYRGALARLGQVVYGGPRCVACMQHPINTVFLDCGHSAFCVECAHTFVEFAREGEGGGGGGGGGRSGNGSGGTRGGGSNGSTPLIPATVRLPCAICREDIREIKQIYVST